MSKIQPHCQAQLNLFRRQYLQLQLDIKYPDAECLCQEAFQNALFEEVFHTSATAYHPPLRYQIRVLKELTMRVEASITDWEEEGISDDLVCRLSSLLASPMPSEAVYDPLKCYVTYTISSLSQNNQPSTITLLETQNLLGAGGTTGFRTWEACLHLGVYLSSPACLVPVAHKNILELGAGSGYLSILCSKYLNAVHVTVTDGSDTIVADLSTNLGLNGLQDSPLLEARGLEWGQTLTKEEVMEWNQGPVDVVLGADLTYDSDGIAALVATLVNLVELFPLVEILIAATIRNDATFELFLSESGRNGLVVNDVQFPVLPAHQQEGPFYCNTVPIRLCHIRRERTGFR